MCRGRFSAESLKNVFIELIGHNKRTCAHLCPRPLSALPAAFSLKRPLQQLHLISLWLSAVLHNQSSGCTAPRFFFFFLLWPPPPPLISSWPGLPLCPPRSHLPPSANLKPLRFLKTLNSVFETGPGRNTPGLARPPSPSRDISSHMKHLASRRRLWPFGAAGDS